MGQRQTGIIQFRYRLRPAGTAMLTVLLLTALLYSAGTAHVNAESEDPGYEVRKLDMRVTVSKDHTIDVEEFISVDITEPPSEIEFAIPDGTYRVTDPELLTEGSHKYTVEYTIHEPADKDKEKDTFRFYVILPEWEQSVATAHALIAFPYGFPLENIRHNAVLNGEPDTEDRFDHKPEKSSASYTATGKRIPENYSFCIEADLPEGYWEVSECGFPSAYAVAVAAGIAVVCVICLYAIIRGRRKGRR